MIEVKKSTAGTVHSAKGKKKSLTELAGEIKQELQHIDWTSGEELRMYTKVVVCAMFCFGMALYFMDLIIQGVLHVIGLFV